MYEVGVQFGAGRRRHRRVHRHGDGDRVVHDVQSDRPGRPAWAASSTCRVVKQIGPVLAAVMLAGRVGGALTAELGTMNVTEQLDALRVMGADPIRYLVVPRFVACLLLTPILTIYSDLLGVLGGWLVSASTSSACQRPVLAVLRPRRRQLADHGRHRQERLLRRRDRADQLLQGLHLRQRRQRRRPGLHRKLRHQLPRDHRAELLLRPAAPGHRTSAIYGLRGMFG